MAPISKVSLALLSAAIAKLASASTALVFPNAGCDETGYYQTIQATNDACGDTVLSDSNFQQVGNNSGEYQAFFSLQTQEADGCAIVIGQNSVDAKAPPCGECVILLHTANQCVQAQLPTPFYTWECCDRECQMQCGQIPGKRTIGEAVEALKAREAEAKQTSPDIANLKNRSPVASAPKAKRSDCSFMRTDGSALYTQAGVPTKVSDTFNTCTSSDGCQQSYTGMVESSFSQTFGVSETTEVGLFDIVSESVTFDYSATWEMSQSISVSGSYTFAEGQGGYLTFSPLSQCVQGTFEGADCAAMNIPTGTEAHSACVPEKIAGGQINGDINVVTSA